MNPLKEESFLWLVTEGKTEKHGLDEKKDIHGVNCSESGSGGGKELQATSRIQEQPAGKQDCHPRAGRK